MPNAIMIYQHLTVTAFPGTDADGRDRQLLTDERSQLCRNTFKDDHERSGFLHIVCILQNPGRLCLALSLDFKTAKSVDRLRRHANGEQLPVACNP